MTEEGDPQEPGINVRPTAPIEEKRDNKPLLIALGLAGLLALLIGFVTYRLVVGPSVRVPDAAVPVAKTSSPEPLEAKGLGPRAASGDRISVGAGADIMVSEAEKVFGGDASSGERKEFFEEIMKSTTLAQVVEDIRKNGTGKLALKSIRERLKGSSEFQDMVNQFAGGGVAGGRGPKGMGGGGDAIEGEDTLESGDGDAAGGSRGAARGKGAKQRYAGAQGGEGALSLLAQEFRRRVSKKTVIGDAKEKKGAEAGQVAVSLNANQWATRLAASGASEHIVTGGVKAGSANDFGFTDDAWVWLQKNNRDKLLQIETEGHNQPGPPPPAVSTCRGTWCQLRSCGKGCVYCWNKYPWGCGGPTWDVNSNHATVTQVCKYFGFEADCKKACDDHPPCQWWSFNAPKADDRNSPDNAKFRDEDGDGLPDAGKQADGEACIMDCNFAGPLPPGCEWDPACPQAAPH